MRAPASGDASPLDARLCDALARASAGEDLDRDAALALLADPSSTEALLAAAAARRDRAWGRTVTYSPKVFLPVTNLCRDRCDYCTFRKDPDDPDAWTMRPEEIRTWAARGRALGCREALLCLGDRPETAFPSYRALLARLGHRTTAEYLYEAATIALDAGLLPHTNAGVLTREEMARLKEVNVSLGLMLESVSPRLRAPGGRHLAPHPRLREPRGPVAARARARGHLRRGGLRARRAAADLPGVRRAAGLSRPRAPRARGGVRARGGGASMSWFDPWEAIEAVALDDVPVERALARAGAPVRTVLERALAGRPPTVAEGERLLAATGPDLLALVRTADAVRAADVGDTVTYVVNRNINFTNVCFVNCRFCAFKRQRWEHDAYTHGLDVVLAKVEEAIARGATEVCMQGGINPEMDAFAYRDLLLAIKGRFPRVHVHAFSPMEIMYGARRTNMDYPAYIAMLRDAGLGSIPGTAAEILDDDVREVLSHKKVDVRTWVEIITTAHRLGVPTTATVMYGHVETPAHLARHLDLM